MTKIWKKGEIVLVINRDSRKSIAKARQLQLLAKQFHLRTVACGGSDLDFVLRQELKQKQLKRLVIAGGDGSVRLATSLVARLNPKVEVAIIPVGTSNYYAKTLGVRSIAGSFETASSGCAQPRYACEANGRIFLMVANIGVVSRMFHEISDLDKKRFGKLAYVWGMLKMFVSFTPMKVSILLPDGQTLVYATTEAQVINQSISERVRVHPEVDSKDPYFEIVTFGLKETKLSPFIGIIVFIFTFGKNQRYVRRIRTNEATISINRPEVVSLDGDSLDQTPVHIKIVDRPVSFVRAD